MSDEKPKLSVVRIGEPRPVSAVVEVLEDLLARANKGEIFSIVCCYEIADVATGHSLAWGKGSTPMALHGELDLAKFAIHIALGRITPPTA